MCLQAPAQQGYVINDAVNLNLGDGPIRADVTCATGFGPEAQVTACQRSGEPYSVAGCRRVFCARTDCAITQMLKPGATESLPPLGVAVTDEICCDRREGFCKWNRNATGNHTQLAVSSGHDTYQVDCGSGYGLVAGAESIEKQTRGECCERLFCTAADCAATQRLKKGYELLPPDGVDVSDTLCCDPIEGMCGGNHDPTTDFSPDDCYPWSNYRDTPHQWLSPVTDSLGKRRRACCGIDDRNVLLWLIAALLAGCCGGAHHGKVKAVARLEDQLGLQPKAQGTKAGARVRPREQVTGVKRDAGKKNKKGERKTEGKPISRQNPLLVAQEESDEEDTTARQTQKAQKQTHGKTARVAMSNPIFDLGDDEDSGEEEGNAGQATRDVETGHSAGLLDAASMKTQQEAKQKEKNPKQKEKKEKKGKKEKEQREQEKLGKKASKANRKVAEAAHSDLILVESHADDEQQKATDALEAPTPKALQGLKQQGQAAGSDVTRRHHTGDVLQATKSQPVRKTEKRGAKVLWKLQEGDLVVVEKTSGTQIKVVVEDEKLLARLRRDGCRGSGWVDGGDGLVVVGAATAAEGRALDMLTAEVGNDTDAQKWHSIALQKAQRLEDLQASAALTQKQTAEELAEKEREIARHLDAKQAAWSAEAAKQRELEKLQRTAAEERNAAARAAAKLELETSQKIAALEHDRDAAEKAKAITEQHVKELEKLLAPVRKGGAKAAQNADETMAAKWKKAKEDAHKWEVKAAGSEKKLEMQVAAHAAEMQHALDEMAALKRECEQAAAALRRAELETAELRNAGAHKERSLRQQGIDARKAAEKAELMANRNSEATRRAHSEVASLLGQLASLKRDAAASASTFESANALHLSELASVKQTLTAKLEQATQEATGWKLKANDSATKLADLERLSKLSTDQAEQSEIESKRKINDAIAARNKAEVELGQVKEELAASKKVAAATGKAAQAASVKSEMQAKQKIDAAERRIAEEIKRRENMETHVKELEAELAAVRSGDPTAVAQINESLTSRVIESTEKARKFEAQYNDSEKRMQAQERTHQIDLHNAQEAVETLRTELDQEKAARAKAEASSIELKHAVAHQEAVAAQAENSAAKIASKADVQIQQRDAALKRLTEEAVLLRKELSRQTEALIAAETAAADAKAAAAFQLAEAEKSSSAKRAAAEQATRISQTESAATIHNLQNEVQLLKTSLAHAMEDVSQMREEVGQASGFKSQVAAEIERLTASLHESQSAVAQHARSSQQALAKADLLVKQQTATADRIRAEEAKRREYLESHLKELEEELAAERSRDPKKQGLVEQSLTKKLQKVTEDARMHRSKAAEDLHRAEEQIDSLKTDLLHAAEDIAAAHAEAEAAVAAKIKSDEQVKELQKTIEVSSQRAADSAKVTADVTAKVKLELEQSTALSERLRSEVTALRVELQATRAEIATLSARVSEAEAERLTYEAVAKSAQNAQAQAAIEVEARLAAAERMRAGELEAQQRLEQYLAELEDELAAVKNADEKATAKKEKSCAARVAEAESAARSFEAKAADAEARLDMLSKKVETSAAHAETVAREAKIEATKVSEAKLKAESDLQQLQQTLSDTRKAAEDAAVASKDSDARARLAEQQRDAAIKDKLVATELAEKVAASKDKAEKEVVKLMANLETERKAFASLAKASKDAAATAELQMQQANTAVERLQTQVASLHAELHSLETSSSAALAAATKQANDVATKAALETQHRKSETQRMQARIASLIDDLKGQKQAVDAATAAAAQAKTLQMAEQTKHADELAAQLQQASDEAAQWKSKAAEDVHRLEEEVAHLQADLEHAVADATALTSQLQAAVSSRSEADVEIAKLREQLATANTTATDASKAAKDARAKASLAEQQLAKAADRAKSVEADMKANAQAMAKELEAQLDAARGADPKAIAKVDASLTSKLAAATEEVRQLKARAAEDLHRLQDEIDHLKTDLKHSNEDVAAAKAHAKQANEAKATAEAQLQKLQKIANEHKDAAESAAKKAKDAAAKAELQGTHKQKRAQRQKEQIDQLNSELKLQKQELADAKAAAHRAAVEHKVALAEKYAELEDKLHAAEEEAHAWKMKAADDVHRLEEEVAHLQTDLQHRTEDVAAAQSYSATVVAAKVNAEAAAAELRSVLEKSQKAARSGTKAAKDATVKAEVAVKQRVAAAERKLAEEVDRRTKAEALLRDLEAEVAALTKGDNEALSKLSTSATSRVAEATQEAQKWKAKATNDAHQFEEQAANLKTDLQHALEDVKRANQDTEDAVAAKAHAEAEIAKLQQTIEQRNKEVAAATKAADDTKKKADLQAQQHNNGRQKLQERVHSLTEELKSVKQELRTVKAASQRTESAHKSELIKTLEPLQEQLHAAGAELTALKAKAAEDVHRLEEEVAHLQADLEHAVADATAAQNERQDTLRTMLKVDAEVAELRNALAEARESAQQSVKAEKAANTKAELCAQQRAEATSRLQEQVTALQEQLQSQTELTATTLAEAKQAEVTLQSEMATEKEAIQAKLSAKAAEVATLKAKATESALTMDSKLTKLMVAKDHAVAEAKKATIAAMTATHEAELQSAQIAAKAELDAVRVQLREEQGEALAVLAKEAEKVRADDIAKLQRELDEAIENADMTDALLVQAQTELKTNNQSLLEMQVKIQMLEKQRDADVMSLQQDLLEVQRQHAKTKMEHSAADVEVANLKKELAESKDSSATLTADMTAKHEAELLSIRGAAKEELNAVRVQLRQEKGEALAAQAKEAAAAAAKAQKQAMQHEAELRQTLKQLHTQLAESKEVGSKASETVAEMEKSLLQMKAEMASAETEAAKAKDEALKEAEATAQLELQAATEASAARFSKQLATQRQKFQTALGEAKEKSMARDKQLREELKKKGEELHDALQTAAKIGVLEKRAEEAERRNAMLTEEREKAQSEVEQLKAALSAATAGSYLGEEES